MADTTPPASPPKSAASPPAAESGVFSLDDLDKIIEAEDPNFKNDIANIKAQKIENTDAIQNLGVVSNDDLNKDEDEQDSKRRKIISFIMKPVNRVRAFLRMRATQFKNFLGVSKDQSINFIRHELPDRLRYYRSRSIEGAKWVLGEWRLFLAMNRLQKGAILFMTLASVGAVFFSIKTFTGHWLPRYEDALPRSLAKKAGIVREFKTKADLQDLFEAFPEVEYHVLLGRVVVNMKPSDGSGQNPMGAFEIFVGVDSQDTAVEVKDREHEVIDIVQRTLETFTYGDAASQLGKSRMKEVIRDHLNEILNQGRVFHIYFNNFLLYSGT